VRSGHTSGDGGPRINITLGRKTTLDGLARDGNDWIMTHEMVHLALSSVEREHHWLEEGSATYVEPIERVRAGELTAEEVWRDMVEHMPQGQPAAKDRGLDGTPTWGRTYWGGAMFCLLADVEIRRRTQNRFGLQDAVRAITRASGGLASEWPIERVLKTGDEAVGTTVLEDLYAQMRDAAVTPDLMALWRKLGVEPDGNSVHLSDDAPLAGIRQSIMRAPISKS